MRRALAVVVAWALLLQSIFALAYGAHLGDHAKPMHAAHAVATVIPSISLHIGHVNHCCHASAHFTAIAAATVILALPSPAAPDSEYCRSCLSLTPPPPVPPPIA